MTDPTEEDAERARGVIERMIQHSDDALERLRDCIQANVLCYGASLVSVEIVDSAADYGEQTHFVLDVTANGKRQRVLIPLWNGIGLWSEMGPCELDHLSKFLIAQAVAMTATTLYPETPL